MPQPELKPTVGAETAPSEEIAAMGAVAHGLAQPMLAVLLAEAEALALMMPGTTAVAEPVRPAEDAEPFDNVPL